MEWGKHPKTPRNYYPKMRYTLLPYESSGGYDSKVSHKLLPHDSSGEYDSKVSHKLLPHDSSGGYDHKTKTPMMYYRHTGVFVFASDIFAWTIFSCWKGAS